MVFNSLMSVMNETENKHCSAAEAGSKSKDAATLDLTKNRLVCVEYPALFNNVDKMLETIGGEQGLSKTYADPSKRLELCYRPKDPYCHPLCGNRFSSSNLLIKVRRRTRKSTGESHVTMEILGLIETTYKFQGMADFQFLAMHNEPDGSQVSLYDKIILNKPEKKDFFDRPVPLFIPPPIFSRLDNPVNYYYRPDGTHREGYMAPTLSKENLIGPTRARRAHNAIFVSFEEITVPDEPLEAAKLNWKKSAIHHSDHKAEEDMRKLFEKRPVWSRNAVKANINIHPEKLKLLLPYVAYYMLTGPWRSLWVRYRYDPRKNPEAKIYQVLDFRIRCGMRNGYGVNEMPVKAKRSAYEYTLPTSINKSAPQPASLKEITQDGASSSIHPSTKYMLKESAYIFRKGMLPPYRQMFYQLCDLHIHKIQEIIHKNDGAEEVCDERDGWCLPRTADELRNILSSMISQVVKSKKSALSSPKLEPVRAGRKMEENNGDEDDFYDYDDDDDNDDDEEYKASEGSENEMETEMLDYM
ncbi:general transcription factor 3C polypeptide 5 [Trichomycterus rosablanca]|uniref:general transcription factor 3C polypeptide 5 n=1 Tax=Trichomycterus rosablanca TaxID=2290929 RepID=UPI002F3576E8